MIAERERNPAVNRASLVAFVLYVALAPPANGAEPVSDVGTAEQAAVHGEELMRRHYAASGRAVLRLMVGGSRCSASTPLRMPAVARISAGETPRPSSTGKGAEP
jgi:hypothetical protein